MLSIGYNKKKLFTFRQHYYNFLQLANEGDYRPFVRFIADCTEKTLDLYLWATSELSHQVPMLAQSDDEYSSSSPLITDYSDYDGSADEGIGAGDGFININGNTINFN